MVKFTLSFLDRKYFFKGNDDDDDGMMMMMINCFCGMIEKAFSLISSWDHSLRSSPSRISDTPRTGFEAAQNLCSGFVE